jgi:hypothetical protein
MKNFELKMRNHVCKIVKGKEIFVPEREIETSIKSTKTITKNLSFQR